MSVQGASHHTPPIGPTPSGQKVRTHDCRDCRIWNSLTGSGMPVRSIQALCDRMWLHVARKGQVLYLEGNQATHLYAVRSGSVRLTKTDASGREHVTALLESSNLFGFEAAFDDTYATGAEAHSDCELCLLTATDLRELMREVPDLSVDIARMLHERLASADERLAFLGNPGARPRLAGYLLWRLPKGTQDAPLVPHELTHRELAGMLGLSAETVCRTLKAFQREGLLAVHSGQILIRDPAALDQLAAG